MQVIYLICLILFMLHLLQAMLLLPLFRKLQNVIKKKQLLIIIRSIDYATAQASPGVIGFVVAKGLNKIIKKGY